MSDTFDLFDVHCDKQNGLPVNVVIFYVDGDSDARCEQAFMRSRCEVLVRFLSIRLVWLALFTVHIDSSGWSKGAPRTSPTPFGPKFLYFQCSFRRKIGQSSRLAPPPSPPPSFKAGPSPSLRNSWSATGFLPKYSPDGNVYIVSTCHKMYAIPRFVFEEWGFFNCVNLRQSFEILGKVRKQHKPFVFNLFPSPTPNLLRISFVGSRRSSWTSTLFERYKRLYWQLLFVA